jgi:hypothetical protein
LNILYNEEVGISFCFLHTPSREAIEKDHEKFGINVTEWNTEVKTTLFL